jgi:hypothetical protein
MTAAPRLETFLAVLVLSVACNGDRPTTPSSLSTQQPPTVQPLPTGGVVPAAIAGIYVASGPLSYPISHYTTSSRFVLRDSGGFSLEYPSLRLDYAGTYANENGRVVFRFAADHRWSAVGTFNGDLLEVRYSLIAGLSDFEDAVYRRSQ